ncbi:MAG: 5'/3'-nucleotidase SurE [Candidatus Muiribacteriota bacterium]
MNFLLTNDDGINSDGIKTLAMKLSEVGKVFVFAPDREKSACSGAMTLGTEINVNKIESNIKNTCFYSVENGFPADCAKLGIYFIREVFFENVDYLVSGINHGENTGIDIRYSGTVGAAFEGVSQDIPSFALSLAFYEKIDCQSGFNAAADFFISFFKNNKNLIQKFSKLNYLFNINYPNFNATMDYKFTYPAQFLYKEKYDKISIGKSYKVKLTGIREFDNNNQEKTDLGTLVNGRASVSLIKPEFVYEKF